MNNEPLAIKMRPKSLKEVVGQEHLIGKDKILTNLIKNKKLFSMILYGSPGIGKTSIAYAIINELDMNYRFLNATINNKKDFDVVIEEAKMYGGLILIMDEIHRLNKDKQDLLLPSLESGLITLIGMTTANPFHSINPAIRSRCHLFELYDLNTNEIIKALKRAVKSDYLKGIDISDENLSYIANIASFDLRYAYNVLELCFFTYQNKKITEEMIKKINNKPVLKNDKNGDSYYDLLSAFQKSIRGSDVDASLYYLGRLLISDDLESVARRLSVIVYEDIGVANSSLYPKLEAAISSALRVGMPEARIPLAAIVIEMALSPKSNKAELAIDKVFDLLNKGKSVKVPGHINNRSKGYKYPHNFKNNYVDQQYLPDEYKNVRFYKPGENKFENLLYDYNKKLKEKK